MNIQSKFLSVLEKELPDHLELVVNYNYSNTGVMLIQPKDSFECVLVINFSFQHNYVSMEISPPIGAGYRVDNGTSMIYISSPFEKLESLIRDIVNYLLRP